MFQVSFALESLSDTLAACCISLSSQLIDERFPACFVGSSTSFVDSDLYLPDIFLILIKIVMMHIS